MFLVASLRLSVLPPMTTVCACPLLRAYTRTNVFSQMYVCIRRAISNGKLVMNRQRTGRLRVLYFTGKRANGPKV